MGQIQTAPASGGAAGAFSGAQLSLAVLRNANENGTLSYDAEDFDVGGWADIGVDATLFTVPAGITHARAGGQVAFSQNVSGNLLLAMQKNLGNVGIGRCNFSFNHSNAVAGFVRMPYQSGYIPVVQGDTIRVQTTGPDVSIAFEAGGTNFFWIEGFDFS